jgi:HK97 family phage major capsid protein
MSDNLETLLEQQGKAFDAFKSTVETELKSKLGKDDPIVTDKLSKIEASLDAAVEAKAKLEAGLEAERKEREALEARINREGIKGGVDQAKRELEIKDFNVVLKANAADRGKPYAPLDAKGYDEYKSAWDHYAREGKENLTPEEVKTLSVGSDPDGGYFVTPDTSGRIVRKVYESSPMRQISAVQVISTDKLEGIEDLGEAGAGYAGEHATSGDTTTPQVGKWEIPVYWIDTEPKTTQQLLDDAAVDIEGWLSGKVADKFARFEESKFVAGSDGRIRGITSYTTAADTGTVAWGQIGHIVTGTSSDFPASNPADKIHDLMGTLKNAYLPNARFLTRRTVITKIRKFKDGMGNYLWQPSFVLGVPETIMGHPVSRAEDMPALGNGSLSLAFGDFAQAYQIVDRQGIRVLRDPYTAKPYIKFYTTKRVGGAVVNFEAVKFLKFGA